MTTINDLGTINANSVKFAPLSPQEIGVGVVSKDCRVAFAVPMFATAETAATFICAAQLQFATWDHDDITRARLNGQAKKVASFPINVVDLELSENKDELFIDIGVGVLNLRLLKSARKKLTSAI